MEDKDASKKIIDTLIANEDAMAELYLAYSDKFPMLKDFWVKISEDERSHAAWIGKLFDQMKAGLVSFAEHRFPADAIAKNIEYLRGEKAKVGQGEMSALYALETAVHIERGMIEHKFFEIFKDDSLELQTLLAALKLGTEQHFQDVQREWEREKAGGNLEKMIA